MTNEATMQQKFKVITKLCESGVDTDKKLLKLDMQSILKIKNITVPDMVVITELMKYAKAGKLYSYLCGGNDEVNEYDT